MGTENQGDVDAVEYMKNTKCLDLSNRYVNFKKGYCPLAPKS